MTEGTGGVPAAQAAVARWRAARAALAEIERGEHPDLTDRFGRVWVWQFGDVYVHDGCLAWPQPMILANDRLPSPALASNPNYRLCRTCTRDWQSQTPDAGVEIGDGR